MPTRAICASLSILCAAFALPASAHTDYASPYIQSFAPTSGAPGTVITVKGSGFSGLNAAWIGTGHHSTVYVASDSVVKITVPKDATTGQVALLNPEHAAWSPNKFSVTSQGGTPPSAPPPKPAPPPAPSDGTSWVYFDGAFDWPGDYSYSAKADYRDTSGEPLSGGYDIKVNVTGPWGGWLPYARNWNFESSPYSKLRFSLKPTISDQKWNVYFVKIGDVPVGIYIDPTKYGPAPEVGKWATYTIPLAALGVKGDSIYKFCIHDETGLSDNVWFVDNVGFEP
jgi:hypothetical protein